MARKLVLILYIVILISISGFNAGAVEPDDSVQGSGYINTDNYANQTLKFFYYIPKDVILNRQKTYPALILVPGLSYSGEQFASFEFKKFARDNKFVIIAPTFIFDERNWNSERSYQYPSAWSGDALVRIVQKFERLNNLGISKLYLYGFSAGAQFAQRFALYRPDMCAACAVYAGGSYDMPTRNVGVKFYLGVGNEDTTRIPPAQNFSSQAKKLGISVVYKVYQGGHFLPSQYVEDTLQFFKNIAL